MMLLRILIPYSSSSTLLVLFHALLLKTFTNVPHAAAADKKPNIVLILADDVGTGDIPRYWNSSLVDMPNLNRLADMGVTFRDAHSTPLCAPSRYMLLSGNYAHRGHNPNGSWNFANNRNQFLDHQQSIAEVLKNQAGYKTSMYGKWHLGLKAPPHGMTMSDSSATLLSNGAIDWSLPLIQGPEDIGFETSYISAEGIQGPPFSFFRDGILENELTDNSIKHWEKGEYGKEYGMSKIGKHPGEGDVDWDSSAFNMIVVNETSKFIDKHMNENPDQPFFTYVSLVAVHIPHSPPYRYLDGSSVRKVYKTRHLDMLLEMDKVVGSIVKLIEDRKLADETIIMFTSDNGGLRTKSRRYGHHISGPLRAEKGSIYEGGHRVPLIMRYDKQFQANATIHDMVGLNDIYATICDLVGVDVPAKSAHDSISFVELLKPIAGKHSIGKRQEIAMWEMKRNRVISEAIRYGSMKLIRHAADSSFELYDLDADISETNDLSSLDVYAEVIDHMYTQLKATGPCPDTSKGQFSIKGVPNKKGCSWFEKNLSRCSRHIEGEINCPLVCGRFKKYCK